MTLPEDRCRLVLVVPDMEDDDKLGEQLSHALRGGDVASVILPQYESNDTAFQKRAEKAGAAGAGRRCCGADCW